MGTLLLAESSTIYLRGYTGSLKHAANIHPYSTSGGLILLDTVGVLLKIGLSADDAVIALTFGSGFDLVPTVVPDPLTWALTATTPTITQITLLATDPVKIPLIGGAVAFQAHPKRPTSFGGTWTEVGTVGAIDDESYSAVYLGSGIILASCEDYVNPLDIYKSTNYGRTWSTISAPMGAALICAGFCNMGGGIVLAAVDGAVYRSTNYGATWASVLAVSTENAAVAGDMASGRMIATVNDPGQCYVSTDSGATWTLMWTFADYVYEVLHLRRGDFLACLEDGTFLKSSSYGHAWKNLGSVLEAVESLAHSGDGRILAVSQYGGVIGVVYSVDWGENWSVASPPATVDDAWRMGHMGYDYARGTFLIPYYVAASSASYIMRAYFESGSGTLSWGAVSSGVCGDAHEFPIDFGTFVILAEEYVDEIDWDTTSYAYSRTGSGDFQKNDMGLGDYNYLYTIASNGSSLFLTEKAYSTDGVNWSANATTPGFRLEGIAYGNTRFVAIRDNGGAATNAATYTTDNGATWNAATLPASRVWQGIAYGAATFVTVGYTAAGSPTNKGAYSTDYGANWIEMTLPYSVYWYAVYYANGTFIALGSGDKYATSADGIAWSGATFPASAGYSVAYGNGVWVVACTYQTYVLRSTDLINWTQVSVTDKKYWDNIVYTGVYFVLSSSGKSFLTKNQLIKYSLDGLTWSNITIVTTGWLNQLTQHSVAFI